MRTQSFFATLLVSLLAACGGSSASSEGPADPPAAPSGPLAPHTRAPEFTAFDQEGAPHSLNDYRGKVVVLYFYPRDGTPGCTEEACAFRDAWDRLEQAGAQVLGVSTDTVESHAEFAAEHSLPFPLLADPDESVAAQYGVDIRMGMAMRTTFLIDREGVIRRVFEDVDPGVHVDEVLDAIAELPPPVR